MSGITTEENALIESVIGSNTLANLVNREPVDIAKFERVRLKNLLGGREADVLSLLVAVRANLELDIEANKSSFSWNDHDRTSILRVD